MELVGEPTTEAKSDKEAAIEMLQKHIMAQSQLNQQFLTISKNLDARLTAMFNVLAEKEICDSGTFEQKVDRLLGWAMVPAEEALRDGDLVWAEYEYKGAKSIIFEVGDEGFDFSHIPAGHKQGYEFPHKGKDDDGVEFDVVIKLVKAKRKLEA